MLFYFRKAVTEPTENVTEIKYWKRQKVVNMLIN